MAKAELLSYSRHNDGKVVATVELVNGEVVITGKDTLQEYIKAISRDQYGNPLSVADGDTFIRCMPYLFTGSYLRARLV
jgi:hypothetical protein